MSLRETIKNYNIIWTECDISGTYRSWSRRCWGCWACRRRRGTGGERVRTEWWGRSEYRGLNATNTRAFPSTGVSTHQVHATSHCSRTYWTMLAGGRGPTTVSWAALAIGREEGAWLANQRGAVSPSHTLNTLHHTRLSLLLHEFVSSQEFLLLGRITLVCHKFTRRCGFFVSNNLWAQFSRFSGTCRHGPFTFSLSIKSSPSVTGLFRAFVVFCSRPQQFLQECYFFVFFLFYCLRQWHF